MRRHGVIFIRCPVNTCADALSAGNSSVHRMLKHERYFIIFILSPSLILAQRRWPCKGLLYVMNEHYSVHIF
jgi:hypothetical protein